MSASARAAPRQSAIAIHLLLNEVPAPRPPPASRQRAGCLDLLDTVTRRVRPAYHVFGHIHEGYGATTNGTTTFVNASTCTVRYQPDNPPLVFDLPARREGCDEEGEGASLETLSIVPPSG